MVGVTLREGDYIVIGEHVKIQVLKTGEELRVGIEVPEDMQIAKGRIFEEITRGRPEIIHDPDNKGGRSRQYKLKPRI